MIYTYTDLNNNRHKWLADYTYIPEIRSNDDLEEPAPSSLEITSVEDEKGNELLIYPFILSDNPILLDEIEDACWAEAEAEAETEA